MHDILPNNHRERTRYTDSNDTINGRRRIEHSINKDAVNARRRANRKARDSLGRALEAKDRGKGKEGE